MDLDEWFAPECADDTDEPDELGLIQYAGGWYTPGQVREFANELLALAAVAEAAAEAAARP